MQIYYNGKIATVDANDSFAEAMAVADGKIAAIGSREEVMALRGSETEMIDLEGRLVLPGMGDSHVHASDFIHNLEHLAVDKCKSLAALQAAVRDSVPADKAEWILGNGLPQELLAAGLDRHVLDEAAPDNPVVIVMWHGHGCVANTRALEVNGISADTPNPPGGIIRREADGSPSGVLEEASAMQLAYRNMKPYTPAQIAEKLKKMQGIMNAMGYTAYTECTAGPANNMREGGASGEGCLRAYEELLERGEMSCRVSAGLYSGRDGKQSFDILKEDLESGVFRPSKDEDMLSFHMVKFFCDGVETSHTAWLKEDYADQPGFRGRSCIGEEDWSEEEQIAELRKMLKLAHDKGYQIGIHTVGSRAVYEAMEAMIAAQEANPRVNTRHCLIHADNFGEFEDMLRCRDNGIIISSQPGLAVAMFGKDSDCVGEKAGENMMPLKTLKDNGLMLCGGSDSIAGEYHDWRYGVQAAVMRCLPGGEPFKPEQRLSVAEAVRMFAYNAAYQEFAEDKRGSLEAGKLADFIVLDRDIYEIPPEEITEARVLKTVLGGKTVYSAQ